MMYLFLLLAGCPESKDCDDACDTGDSSGHDSAPVDTDSDTDEAPPEETGLARFYFVGDHEVTDGAYVTGHFGYAFYGVRADDWVCRVEGELTYEGPAPEGCPDCEWAFDLSSPGPGVLTGDACASLGVDESMLGTGTVDYSWGFSSNYVYYYEDEPLYFADTLLIYFETEGWFAFAFDYGHSGWIEGDASSLTFTRPGFSGDGAYVYYYYYP